MKFTIIQFDLQIVNIKSFHLRPSGTKSNVLSGRCDFSKRSHFWGRGISSYGNFLINSITTTKVRTLKWMLQIANLLSFHLRPSRHKSDGLDGRYDFCKQTLSRSVYRSRNHDYADIFLKRSVHVTTLKLILQIEKFLGFQLRPSSPKSDNLELRCDFSKRRGWSWTGGTDGSINAPTLTETWAVVTLATVPISRK